MIKVEKIRNTALCILFSFCIGISYAQSCDQTYYGAKELYNKGQFNRVLDLLNPCVGQYKSDSEAAQNNSDQVFRLFKLYIASCNQAYDGKRANIARKDLATIFGMSSEQVGQRLKKTPL